MVDSTGWIRFHHRERQLYISRQDRFETLVHTLPNPHKQSPSLTLFLGKTQKDNVVSHLYPAAARPRRKLHNGTISLHLDHSSLEDASPRLLAECDPYPQTFCSRLAPSRGHNIAWNRDSTDWPTLTLLVQGIFNLSAVVCIFADDYGGLSGVRRLLEVATAMGKRDVGPTVVLPSLIIVHHEHRTEGEIMPIRDMFSRIIFHNLAHETPFLPPEQQYHKLRCTILQCLEISHDRKSDASALYSALHQQDFYKYIIDNVCGASPEEIDFLSVARRTFQSSKSGVQHFEKFVSTAIDLKIPHDAIQAVLASCLLLDAYPPQMHAFDPCIVFERLYQQDCAYVCYKLWGSSGSSDLILQGVRNEFLRQANLLNQGQTSACLRQNQSVETSSHWALLRSNETCFGCLFRRPEHNLACGHCICDTCTEIYGCEMPGAEGAFLLNQCCVCSSKIQQQIHLKPRTAAARLLSIDGGGTRGVVPLEVLSLLQELLGANQVQDFFDYTTGTSAGGLIVLGLFAKGWTVQRCQQVFQSLSRKFFSPSQQPVSTFLDHCRRLFRSAINDYVYDVGALEKMLIESFGHSDRLFDHDPLLRASTTKIAVTATTEAEPTARLFTNYNGLVPVSEDCGYLIERSIQVEDEPRIWQIARATSAVPVLFPSIHIEKVGTYWDGALSRHNNPTSLALWESQRLWPQDQQPDVVVSLGTGTKGGCGQGETSPSFWNALKHRGIPKFWTSLMLFLEGEQSWKDLCNRLTANTKKDYFRFNILLPDGLPSISDTSSMSSLCDSVRTQSQGSRDLMDAVSALIVSCFFMELNVMPIRTPSGSYHVQGFILCRIPDPRNLIRTLQGLYTNNVRIFDGNKDTGLFLDEHDVCGECRRFRRRIDLVVDSLQDIVNLQFSLVDSNGIRFRRLSSMPRPVSWFVEAQQLDRPFGLPNHGRPQALHCSGCSITRSALPPKRLKRSMTTSQRPRKRQCTTR